MILEQYLTSLCAISRGASANVLGVLERIVDETVLQVELVRFRQMIRLSNASRATRFRT
jgi:hypothetical protein